MWTKEQPKEAGFYWRKEGDTIEVVEMTDLYGPDEPLVMHRCGTEIPYADWMSENFQIQGEFWSVKLEPPL